MTCSNSSPSYIHGNRIWVEETGTKEKRKSCSHCIQTKPVIPVDLLQQPLSKLQTMHSSHKWQLTVWPNKALITSSTSTCTHNCWSKCALAQDQLHLKYCQSRIRHALHQRLYRLQFSTLLSMTTMS